MNQFKNIPPEEEPYLKKQERKARGVFETVFSGEGLTWESVQANLPFGLFLFVLLVVYIGNRNYTEGLIIDSDRIGKELKELRWEYMTTKSELMYKSNQSQVAKRVGLMGLKESVVPPQKIIITSDDEY